MNEQNLRELFAGQESGQDGASEPALSPGYLESTVGAARAAHRRRRVRNAVAGGVAALAVLALVGVAVRPHLTEPAPRLVGAAAGAGSYDPLVARLRPGWLPDGYNLYEQGYENSTQSLRLDKWTGAGRHSELRWSVNIYLYPPGVEPAKHDAPLAGEKFGTGKKVDPVQGMPAELMRDQGYTLAWRYPTGAHAVVTLENVQTEDRSTGGTEGTGFGDRTASVARRIADGLHIDGNAALRFPFTVTRPKGQQIVAVIVRHPLTGSDGVVSTDVLLSFASSPNSRTWSTVEVQYPVPTDRRTTKTEVDRPDHGFFLQVRDPSGHAEQLADQVDVFGSPTSMRNWRPDPLRH